jgi:hypothetical protein
VFEAVFFAVLLNSNINRGPLLHNAGHISVSGSDSRPDLTGRPTTTVTIKEPVKMRLKFILQLPPTIAIAILLFSCLVLASPNSDNKLIQRDEEEGSGCSTEGQWHCMTNSFQRCAGGHWSMKMAMAEGTKCVPAGYTDDFEFRIERDGQDDDEENRSDENRSNGGSNLGAWNSNSVITVVVVSTLWALV